MVARTKRQNKKQRANKKLNVKLLWLYVPKDVDLAFRMRCKLEDRTLSNLGTIALRAYLNATQPLKETA